MKQTMKKAPQIGTSIGTMINVGNGNQPLTQSMVDSANWKHRGGQDQVTGNQVNSLYTADFGTHIAFTNGNGDFTIYDKSELRVALVGAAEDIDLAVAFKS